MVKKQRLSPIPLLKDLRENDPDDFRNYLRMDVDTFDLLLNLVKGGLIKQNTVMREASSPEQRLMDTLCFLATGRSYEDLKYSVGISAQALRYFIPETCAVIFKILKTDYMLYWSHTSYKHCIHHNSKFHIHIFKGTNPGQFSGMSFINFDKFGDKMLRENINTFRRHVD